jgi:hypothetical protein
MNFNPYEPNNFLLEHREADELMNNQLNYTKESAYDNIYSNDQNAIFNFENPHLPNEKVTQHHIESVSV